MLIRVSLILRSKAFFLDNFRDSSCNHQIGDKKTFILNVLLKPSELKSDFTPTLGYLNPALEQPGP